MPEGVVEQGDAVAAGLEFGGIEEPAEKLKFAKTIMTLISDVAAQKGVNLFRRFALMKRWIDDGASLADMDDGAKEHLHTSEWATNCVTQALFEAITQRVDAAADA